MSTKTSELEEDQESANDESKTGTSEKVLNSYSRINVYRFIMVKCDHDGASACLYFSALWKMSDVVYDFSLHQLNVSTYGKLHSGVFLLCVQQSIVCDKNYH